MHIHKLLQINKTLFQFQPLTIMFWNGNCKGYGFMTVQNIFFCKNHIS